MERTEAVHAVSFLRELDHAELGRILEASETREVADGAVLVEEATRGTGLFVLLAGTARVGKTIDRGHEEMLATLQPGDHFGEMSLLTDTPTSASVRAQGKVSCVFFPRERFLGVLEAEPAIGRKVLWALARTLSHRLVLSDRRIARALRRKARFAAVRHLMALAWMQNLILWSYVWVWLRRKVGLGHSIEALARIHRKNARRFRETACRLKGANVKLGQIASLQAHILPAVVVDELRSMRDQVTPTEFPLVAAMVEQELGASPLDVFDEFDKVPLACASMGQVHLAKLRTGEQVVVKILHPGLEQSVEVDLWLMRALLRMVSRFAKKIDLMQLYRENEEPLRKELDLLHEAQATEEIGRELEPIGVKVPKVYWRYSTRRLLTLEYLDGTNLDDRRQIDEWGVDRKKLATSFMEAFVRQALEGGHFHCDPHPGNAFCLRTGQLALLDFGMVKRLPEMVRAGLLKEVLGSFLQNPRLYADGIIDRGVVSEGERGTLEKFAAEVFVDPHFRSAMFDHDVKRDGDMKELGGKLSQLLKQLKSFKTPQDQLMFLRALGIVIDVCREVCPEATPSQIAMPIFGPVVQRFVVKNPQYMGMIGPPSS